MLCYSFFLKNENASVVDLKIVNTSDKSDTLYNGELNEHYHSINGAISESLHIFIDAGLNYSKANPVKIFEVGFGTGLNAILTFKEAINKGLSVHYTSIELHPIDFNIIKQLNYNYLLPKDNLSVFYKMHECEWNENINISKNFSFKKIHADFTRYDFSDQFDLIYFDAFAPEKQPHLWTYNIFKKVYDTLSINGILTTYSSKGIVKDNLRQAGFVVKKLNGPKGKRHMVRALKNIMAVV